MSASADEGARAGDAAAARVARDGYVVLRPEAARALLDPGGRALSGEAWARFAASWGDLGLDGFMADGGRYRLRRHGVWEAGPGPGGAAVRAPDAPHWQALEHNGLNGGVARRFEPVRPEVGEGPAMRALLAGARAVFDRLAPGGGAAWRIEAHQFRILAARGEAGRPTPEGMHRDGVDYVLVALVARENVEGGATAVRAADPGGGGDGGEGGGGGFTLREPMDAVLLDDRRVRHGVTPVVPLDPARPGHRDVLVVTFARRAG